MQRKGVQMANGTGSVPQERLLEHGADAEEGLAGLGCRLAVA